MGIVPAGRTRRQVSQGEGSSPHIGLNNVLESLAAIGDDPASIEGWQGDGAGTATIAPELQQTVDSGQLGRRLDESQVLPEQTEQPDQMGLETENQDPGTAATFGHMYRGVSKALGDSVDMRMQGGATKKLVITPATGQDEMAEMGGVDDVAISRYVRDRQGARQQQMAGQNGQQMAGQDGQPMQAQQPKSFEDTGKSILDHFGVDSQDGKAIVDYRGAYTQYGFVGINTDYKSVDNWTIELQFGGKISPKNKN